VKHARIQLAYADLRAVTASYEDVERDLGIQPEADTEAGK